MSELDDAELLSAYASRQSEEAFSMLVERYIALVYSAALRQVQNPEQAQEVAQAVFIILAQKAGKLSDTTVLAGWLCRTAHFVARNTRRTEYRRLHREQEAYMQSLLNEPDAKAWAQMSPLLDEAVAQLNERDRSAIVLRFYQQKPLNEVGNILGVDPDTAQKRVSRALDKLRKFYSKRGVVSTTAIIATAISGNSVQAAPIGLAGTVTATAAKGAAIGSSTSTLVKGAIKLMAWSKVKVGIIASVAVLLAAGTVTVVSKNVSSSPTVAEIFARYTKSKGPMAGADKTTTLTMKGVFESGDGLGTLDAAAIVKAPDRWLEVLKAGGNPVFRRGFDGVAGWEVSPWGGPDLDPVNALVTGIILGAYRGDSLAALLPKASLKGKEPIGKRSAYVVEVKLQDQSPQLWFDTQTGLLVRINYAIGAQQYQMDGEDYREIDGLVLPFVLRQSGAEHWTLKFTEVKRNEAVADDVFSRPKA